MSIFHILPQPIDYLILLLPVIISTQRNLFLYYYSDEFKDERKRYLSLIAEPLPGKNIQSSQESLDFSGGVDIGSHLPGVLKHCSVRFS
jgi:hypothetical protein